MSQPSVGADMKSDANPISTLHGKQAELVPVSPKHASELRRIFATPQVQAYWGDEGGVPDQFPFEDSSVTRFAVIRAGTVCGMIQYGEEDDAKYRHASIDIFLDPQEWGRGLGHDAVSTIARYLLVERGHHRLVIDPAVDNAAAIRCYSKAGFRPVGRMRRYERDPDGDGWHDGLLMDLLVEDLELGL